MEIKYLGGGVVIIGLILLGVLYGFYLQENMYIEAYTENNAGSCFTDEGICLHADRSYLLYIIGGSLSLMLVGVGSYMFLYGTTQKRYNDNIVNALHEVKAHDAFTAFLAGFTDDEQAILKVVKKQEGIKQSTLRYKTGIAKAKLSLLLKSLEGRGVISHQVVGKTNQVYMRAKY